MKNQAIHYGTGLGLVLLLITGVYWPGLNGIFLLDDQHNLAALAQIETNSIREWGQFIFEGHAGSSGRPIALLSFASQFYDWPTEIWSFKYVNLMLHLLNGCLIFWFIYLLSYWLLTEPHQRILLAGLTATLWLAHPLHVSTVLYTIQRMTQLATLWTLVGLIIYLKGRLMAQQTVVKSYTGLAVGLSLILAILSKENGILLCLYILIVEITIFARYPKPRYWHYWLIVFVYFPLLLLLGYLSLNWDNFIQSYSLREFTLSERLLTQARILLDYLAKLTLVNPQDFGLFHDDYPYSQGLFTPLTTLFSILMILALLIGAWWQRQRYPLLALALLWFLGGHSLESTFLPLALYFEHRNYLPSLGILLALVFGFFYLLKQLSSPGGRRIVRILGVIALILVGLLTKWQTQLWGRPLEQAVVWAQQHPQSRFAQSHAAQLLVNRGYYAAAESIYRTMVQRFPQDAGPYIIWLTSTCQHPQMTAPQLQQLWPKLENTQVDTATISSLMSLLTTHCTALSPQQLAQMLKLLIQRSQHQPYYLAYLYYLKALLAAQQQQFTTAITQIEQALALKELPVFRFKKLSWLIQAEQLPAAVAYLQQTQQHWSVLRRYLYAKELSLFATQIQLKQEIQTQFLAR